MFKNISISAFVICLSFLTGCLQKKDNDKMVEEYFNLSAPGTKPVPFAPDFFLKNKNVRDVAFTPDYKEFYFTQINNDIFSIMFSRYESGEWTSPVTAPFSGVYNDFEPCISPDGGKFYFASMRPSKGKEEMINDIDIWIMERKDNGWGEPKLLGENINTKCMEYYPSVTKDGTLYFGRNDLELTRGDIHFSRFTNGHFTVPEKLPEIVNLPESSFNAFIARDESYLIFSSYIQDNQSFHSDLHISFRDKDGNWNEPQNMGDQINSKGNDISPWVSYDKRYLFFASTRLDTSGQNKNHNIFWVSADIIKDYRLKNER